MDVLSAGPFVEVKVDKCPPLLFTFGPDAPGLIQVASDNQHVGDVSLRSSALSRHQQQGHHQDNASFEGNHLYAF